MLAFFLLTLTFANQTSPCLSKWQVTGFSSVNDVVSSSAISMTNQCYFDIDEYSYLTDAFNLKTRCVVHVSTFFEHIGGHEISRCGQCLKIIGPSMNPIICTITGSYNRTDAAASQSAMERTIGVSQELYTQLVPVKNGVLSALSLVTVQQVDCPYSSKPMFVVENRTEDEVKFKLINTNSLVEFITYNGEKYYSNENGSYILPINEEEETSRIQFKSIKGEILSLKNISLQHDDRVLINENFEITNYDECGFFTIPVIFNNDTSLMETGLLYTWLFFQKNGYVDTGSFVPVQSSTDYVLFTASESTTSIVFMSKHSLKMGVIYNYLELLVVVEGSANFSYSRTGFVDEDESAISGGTITCDNLQGETYINEIDGGVEMKIKIGFNQRCVSYSNLIGLIFETEIGTNFYLKTAELVERIDDEKPSCGQSSFDCDDTECTIDEDSVESDNPKDWEEGCRPICGVCRVGYSCSTAGKCVVTPNYNIRSKASSIMMMVVLLLIHFFI
ncbi:ShKT domain-containing protein [Entamoeba marina]